MMLYCKYAEDIARNEDVSSSLVFERKAEKIAFARLWGVPASLNLREGGEAVIELAPVPGLAAI
jgi:hypothetical protein